MTNIQRYSASDLPELMEKIARNSIGLDDYIQQFWNSNTNANYPPYNIVHVNNVESRLEIALAGFKKKEVKVYTEYGKIFVEGTKEKKEEEHDMLIENKSQWTLAIIKKGNCRCKHKSKVKIEIFFMDMGLNILIELY